ncbi:molecular chaperone [Altererythrobacter salegens]|uniref:Molecular chaperone n=1 Tax=Croceibacterium salegens TaxID=1737568 RepID=A0A6I4SRY2_9SPHN|nr:ATP12 family protein [Croceibacterium salegens]MXO58108.1 molecular chaperone [Croceibacterium salegens]
MKRFWKDAAVEQVEGDWRVTLDGRPIKTQGGGAQLVPSRALAEALAAEWAAQGEEIDPRGFVLRDLTDYAIDRIAPAPGETADKLLPYAETDTLCYRADPDEPLYKRQVELWEPLVTAFEARHGLRMERVSGVVHRPQPPETLARLRKILAGLDPFALAALETLTTIAASLTVGLAALEDGADIDALFTAANCEEDWQAELWGWDFNAEERRKLRLEAFQRAAEFARLAHEA